MNAFGMLATHKELFVQEPQRYFTRKRKMPLRAVFAYMLTSGSQPLQITLNNFYDSGDDQIGKSGFIKRLALLTPDAFQQFFYCFTRLLIALNPLVTIHGFIAAAIDGSDFNLPTNPSSVSTYYRNGTAKGFNMTHANVLYDCLNHRILDAVIAPKDQANEREAYIELLTHYAERNRLIVLSDRGYESWAVVAWNLTHLQLFVCRAKDIFSNGILSSFGLDQFLNPNGTLDVMIRVTITANRKGKSTKRTVQQISNHEYDIGYRFVSTKKYSEICNEIADINDTAEEIVLEFRVVRFQTTENQYATVITNLPLDPFTLDDIKELYHHRWMEEEGFKAVKHFIGSVYLHHISDDYWRHEVWAKFTEFNYLSALHMNNQIAYAMEQVKLHGEELGIFDSSQFTEETIGDNIYYEEIENKLPENVPESVNQQNANLAGENVPEPDDGANDDEEFNVENSAKTRHYRQISFSISAQVFRKLTREHLSKTLLDPKYTTSVNPFELVRRFSESVKKGRSFARNIQPKGHEPFSYRAPQ